MSKFKTWLLFHGPLSWLARICDFISNPIRKAQMRFIFGSFSNDKGKPITLSAHDVEAKTGAFHE